MSKNEIEAQEKQEIETTAGEPTREGLWFRPRVDIFETEEGITLRCDMPGVSKSGLDIDLREDTLTVSGRVDPLPENRQRIHYEYDLGGFTRQFRVGEAVVQARISAFLTNGVLTVNLPKAEKIRPRKIEVSMG